MSRRAIGLLDTIAAFLQISTKLITLQIKDLIYCAQLLVQTADSL